MQKRNNNGGGGGKMRHNRRFQHRGGNNRGNNDGQNIARQKHHATQMREKFSNLAKDAQMNGDHVDMEYYLQHVDHYQRVLTEIAAIEAERFAAREQQQQPTEGYTPDADAADVAEAAPEQADAANAPVQAQQRAPRRPYNGGARRQQANGDEPNPNANTTEIPLPASVIPQIMN